MDQSVPSVSDECSLFYFPRRFFVLYSLASQLSQEPGVNAVDRAGEPMHILDMYNRCTLTNRAGSTTCVAGYTCTYSNACKL